VPGALKFVTGVPKPMTGVTNSVTGALKLVDGVTKPAAQGNISF